MKRFKLATTLSLSLSLSLSAIATSGCLLTTSCSDNKDKLIISGSNKITSFVNYSGEEDYQVIDVNKTEPVNGSWSLEGVDKDCFFINTHPNNENALAWTARALSDVKDYHVTLVCSYSNMNTKKDIVISNLADPLPTPTRITIYGSNNLSGQKNTANHSDYVCTDSNGHRIVGAQWSLINNPTWLTINNNGLLQWTNECENNTYDFIIRCSRQGLNSGQLSVQLVITNSIVVPTSIFIYGSTELTGVSGTTGTSDYVAIDNNGHKITSGSWTLNKINGCEYVDVNDSGQVSWSSNATSGTFTLSCVTGGLTGTSEIITLTINQGPNPSVKIFKHLMSVGVRSVTFSYENENTLPSEGFWYYSISNKKETTFSEFMLNAEKWVNPNTSILIPEYGQFIFNNDHDASRTAEYIYIKTLDNGYALECYNFANNFICEHTQSEFDNEFQSSNVDWFNVDVMEVQ